jgi:putative NADH-flavin reductase
MKLVVFGASGGTGQKVVEQALAQGHQVTAFVRNASRLPLPHEQLRLFLGDALDPQAVAGAVAGQDAAVVALGSQDRNNRSVRAEGTANVLWAMKQHGVTRLVVVSAGGVGDSYQAAPLILKAIIKTVLRHVYADHEQQEQHVRDTALDWIIVRPVQLIDGAPTGQVHPAVGSAHPPGRKVARADVAGFVLEQLADDRYLQKAVSIS